VVSPLSTFFRISPPLRELIVGVLLLVAIVAAHRFSIAYPLELSADESELLVQVGRYDHDLVPWRSVDGSTIGPVNPWFLLVARGVGWPMTYGGLHLLGAFLQAVIVITSYATVRLFLPFRVAGLVALADEELLVLRQSELAGENLVYSRDDGLGRPAILFPVFLVLVANRVEFDRKSSVPIAAIGSVGEAGIIRHERAIRER